MVIQGAVVEDVTPTGASDLLMPSGLALFDGLLYVSDHATGILYAVTLTGEPVTQLDTGLGPGTLAGITVGILSFSRILHALLARAQDGTMAALAGLMIGSLYKLWPWQSATMTGEVPIAPMEGLLLGPSAACVVGMALVGAFLYLDRREDPVHAPDPSIS